MTRLRGAIVVLLALAGWFLNAHSAHAAAVNLKWIDLSASVPTTTLDETSSYNLLSFASSRGTDWLAGNPNQLFLVSSKGKVFDLTPDLKKFGFQKIRQVASDGQNWLVVGDSGPWFSQPDLAFRYDGMYWKNVSPVMAAMPAQEWIGQITGKRGLWVIPTNRSLFVWHSALKDVVDVPLPKELERNGYRELQLLPVSNGWIMEALVGEARLYYLFDGQNFHDIRHLMGDVNRSTILGSNGANILALTAISTPEKLAIRALACDGQTSHALDASFKSFLDLKRKDIRFFPEADMIWDGKSWLLADYRKHLAVYDGRSPAVILPDTRDTFIASAYGMTGFSLHVGFNQNIQGELIPRLVLTRE